MAVAAILSLVSLSVPVGAQGSVLVTGRVVDAATGAPLPAATLRLVEVHRAAQSHEDGSFSFGAVPGGRYQLAVQRIGYQGWTREIVVSAGMAPVLVELTVAPQALQATVVTGQVSERSPLDALSSTSVLTSARLDRRLDGTIGSTLAGLPGLASASMGPATARPVIRGLSGDRVLILEDGARTGDLSNTSMDHAVAVDPLTSSRVEVVRGPMSLLYGSSALGGVVNLIRQEIPNVHRDHMHGATSAQASSANAGGAIGGFAELPVGGLMVRTEGSARRAGDLRTPVGRLGNTDMTALGGAIGISKVGDRGYAGVSYRYFGNTYGVPGGFVGAHPNGVDIAMRRHMVRAESDWHPGDGAVESVKSHLVFTGYSHEEMEKSGRVATSFEQLMTAGEVVVRHRGIGVATGGAAGVRGQYRDVTPAGALRGTPTADWSLAGFVVEEFGTGALRGQAGLRYDLAQFIPLRPRTIVVGDDSLRTLPRRFAALSGSVGALYAWDNGVRVGANASRSFRTPDFNELYSDGPHLAAYSYDVGDPRLRQETGLGLDLFARVERPRVRGELTVFANRLDGYLFPRNTGELGRVEERWKFQFSNEDAVLVGGEGELEITLREHLVADATVSYVRGAIRGPRGIIPGLDGAPDVRESRYLPLMPPLNGRVGLRHETPRWSYGGAVRLAAAQQLIGDFETETAGYATLDLHLGWRLVIGSRLHSVTVRVDNAFDAEVRDHLSRTKSIIPEVGRNVVLLYRVQF